MLEKGIYEHLENNEIVILPKKSLSKIVSLSRYGGNNLGLTIKKFKRDYVEIPGFSSLFKNPKKYSSDEISASVKEYLSTFYGVPPNEEAEFSRSLVEKYSPTGFHLGKFREIQWTIKNILKINFSDKAPKKKNSRSLVLSEISINIARMNALMEIHYLWPGMKKQ